MTVLVVVDANGFIIDAAPIIQRFRGQHFDQLVGWIAKQGGLMVDRLTAE